MESLREHLNLLYGPEMVDRLNNLGLHQDDCCLTGLLIQLALDGKVAMLSGSDFLRLCNVYLLNLLDCCHVTHEGLASKFIDDLAIDLDTFMISIESIYGLKVSDDFNHLVTALLKNDLTFECAVEKILHGEYGNPYAWEQAHLQVDADYRNSRGPMFETLFFESTVPDNRSDVDC
jgi:hypothetical protein